MKPPSDMLEEEEPPDVSEEEEETPGVEEEEEWCDGPPISPLSHPMKPHGGAREEERCGSREK
jgi:hypothetical protein